MRLVDDAMGEEGTEVGPEDDFDWESGDEVDEDPIKALLRADAVFSEDEVNEEPMAALDTGELARTPSVFSEDEMNEEPPAALFVDILARGSRARRVENVHGKVLVKRNVDVNFSTPIVV